MERERKSKVSWYDSHLGGNLYFEQDFKTIDKLTKLIEDFGIVLEEEARTADINFYSAFPIFRDFHLVANITTNAILYVAYPSTGGTVRTIWNDYRKEKKEPDLKETIETFHARYGWQSFWFVEFSSNILEKDTDSISKEFRYKAKEKVEEAVKKFEIESRQVKFNPIFKGRDFLLENDLCFVLMPLEEPFLRIYKEHIKPSLENLGFRVIKANDIFTSNEIMEDIWGLINKSRIIVADVTGKNANVFYELGISHTIGKDYIVLTQNELDVPFDLKHRRYFKYTDNKNGWKKLRQDLEAVVRTIE